LRTPASRLAGGARCSSDFAAAGRSFALPRIRSLAYFQPVIEELLESPVPDGYLQYLRL
jgi:hypothetical protein